MLRTESTSKEQIIAQKDGIIRDYKEITGNLSHRLENKEVLLEEVRKTILLCQPCAQGLQKCLGDKNELLQQPGDQGVTSACETSASLESPVVDETRVLNSKVEHGVG